MIPKKLTIQGLYSYKEKAVINFEKLTSSGLFGIFGKVGSGKSSILEALSFALYGNTERLNKSGDSRNYNMLNLKSDKLLIDFEFIAGQKAEKFKVTVNAKRNSKQFDKVSTLERAAYKLINNSYTPISDTELEESIGLSYNNFKRTIIIPQGKFQEFLQLGTKERTNMLKELFNLQKYELLPQTATLEKESTNKLNNILGSLSQLEDINKENLDEYKSQLSKSLEQLNNYQKTKIAAEKKLQELEEIKENIQKHAQIKTKLDAHLKNKDKINKLKTDLKHYRFCITNFKELIDNLSILEKEKTKIDKEIDLCKKNINRNKKAQEIKSQQLDNLTIEQNKAPIKQQRTQYIESVINIIRSKKTIEHCKSRIQKGEKFAIDKQADILNTNNEIETTQNNYKKIKSDLKDITNLTAIREYLNKLQDQKSQITETEKKINKEQDELKNIIDEAKSSLNNTSENLQFSRFDKAINKLQESKESLGKKEQEVLDRNTALRIEEKLEQFADNLQTGSPCPLCGSEHHPRPLAKSDIEIRKKELSKEKQKLSKQIKLIDQSIDKVKELNIKYQQTEKNITELIQHKENLLKQKIESPHNADKYNIDSINKEINTNRGQVKELDKLIELQNTLQKEKAKKERELENYKAELTKIKDELTAETAKVETLKNNIPAEEREKLLQKDENSLKDEKENLLTDIENTKKEFDKLTKELQEINKHLDSQQGALNILESNIKSIENKLDINTQKLAKEIFESEYDNIDIIKEHLSQNININESEEKINIYERDLHLLQTKENELKAITKSQDFSEDLYNNTKQELTEINKQLNELQELKGKLSGEIEKVTAKLEQKNKLLTDKELLEKRLENLSILKGLFRSNGFVNYVSTVYLKNLCAEANKRFFKLTKQQAQLEINEDNEFIIRDFLNNGKTRSVKTLSGGQTFQAALSLALALSDNIQSLVGSKQNFFFLDEGFGSLDKESLQIVFDTLKALHKENRIVGVISHVEEMQKEIDVHLLVENNPDKGSLVNYSWDG